MRPRAQPSKPQLYVMRKLLEFYCIVFIVIVIVNLRHRAQPSKHEFQFIQKLIKLIWKLLPNEIVLQLYL